MAQQRDEFDSARPKVAKEDRINLRDVIGKTVLFSPTEYVPTEKDEKGEVTGGIPTADFGRKDVVLTDMVVLDADGGPAEHTDVMIFNGFAVGDLKTRVGGKYLAVVEYGTDKVKGNLPIKLNPPSEAQKQMARDYLAGRVVAQATTPVEDDDPFKVNS